MESKIDFVVTWVDGNDAKWLETKFEMQKKLHPQNTDAIFDAWNNNEARYRDWETLKYWFRGVEKNAPWVNKIHFVTCGQVPAWLNTNHPKLHLVNHEDYMENSYLPTFNSNAIELNMYKIDGLAEQFVYFNDDVFIVRKVEPTDFFYKGLPRYLGVLDCVPFEWNVGHPEINNYRVLNKYFSKENVIKKNWGKWFSPRYGKYLLKTLMLMPFHRDTFTGICQPHISIAYLKSTFEEVWKYEKTQLEETCLNHFRNDNNLNLWLVKDWDICRGNFYPASAELGRYYERVIDDDLCTELKSNRHQIVCINDVKCSHEEFLIQKAKLLETLDFLLPEKSTFEK